MTAAASNRSSICVALARCLGIAGAAIGAVVLAGWTLHIGAPGAFQPAGIVMKTNTAIAMFCAGVSLALLAPTTRRRWRAWLGAGLAVIPIGIGSLTLVQHVTGLDFGIDQALFYEAPGSPATASPNRMGPPAAVTFPLLGIGLLLLRRTRVDRAPAQACAVMVMVIALVPLLGYFFDVRELYGVARYTGIAPHTATGFMLLALGLILARPEAGFMRRLLANDSGGVLLRRMIPAAVVLPILLAALLVKGEQAGLYDLQFGRTLLVLGFILIFTALTWWTGRAVHRHVEARTRAEAAEREMQTRLIATLESERNARAIAERSNRMKDEFLATLSHELRTPLNAILGWIQLLVHEGVSERDSRRGLDAIERNSRLLVQLIEDLLDMSRIELGRIRLDVQPVDLTAVIDATLAAAAPAGAAKSVTLERRLEATVGDVQGDPARLQQVLWNLVNNAIKFTPAGGRVTVTLQRGSGHIDISVRDTGIGIDPEFLSQVFDRFRQADGSSTRRFGGLGLGLSIARQLTELHGGALMAESDGPNRGATFTIRLPAVPGAPAAPSGAGQVSRAPSAPSAYQ
jgi:signal transduction histidine kinase